MQGTLHSSLRRNQRRIPAECRKYKISAQCLPIKLAFYILYCYVYEYVLMSDWVIVDYIYCVYNVV